MAWSRRLDSCCTGPLCCKHDDDHVNVEDEVDNEDHDNHDDNDDAGDNGEDDNDGDKPAPAIAVPILGIKANIGG